MRNTRSHLLNGPAVSLFGLAAGNLQVRTFLLFKLLCRASSLHGEPQVGEANVLRCRTNLPAGIQRNTLKLVPGKFSWFQFPFVHVLRPRILVTAMETLHSLIFLLNWIYLLETLHSYGHRFSMENPPFLSFPCHFTLFMVLLAAETLSRSWF